MAPVLIIGAGAAGISAAYTLTRAGIDVLVLEASAGHGGRVQTVPANSFADIPINLGGETIHRDPSILDRLLGKKVSHEIETFKYMPSYALWTGGAFEERTYNREGDEHKFVNFTWYDFFEEYMFPDVKDKLVNNCEVNFIDYSSSPVKVVCPDSDTVYKGSEVIITVPIKQLQDGGPIDFQPDLPQEIRSAINAPLFPAGQKVFLKFDHKFYPDAFRISADWNKNMNLPDSDRLFYSESFERPSSNDNVLGIYIYGDLAAPYAEMSDNNVIESIIDDLEKVFPGVAKESFIEGIVQNWSQADFIFGAFSSYYKQDRWEAIDVLRNAAVRKRIYFAGEAVPVADDNGRSYEWGYVHGASLSGKQAADRIIKKRMGDADDTSVPTSSSDDPSWVWVNARGIKRSCQFINDKKMTAVCNKTGQDGRKGRDACPRACSRFPPARHLRGNSME